MIRPAPIHLIRKRCEAWRDVQAAEALLMCGHNVPRVWQLFEAALAAYEQAANDVERARFEQQRKD